MFGPPYACMQAAVIPAPKARAWPQVWLMTCKVLLTDRCSGRGAAVCTAHQEGSQGERSRVCDVWTELGRCRHAPGTGVWRHPSGHQARLLRQAGHTKAEHARWCGGPPSLWLSSPASSGIECVCSEAMVCHWGQRSLLMELQWQCCVEHFNHSNRVDDADNDEKSNRSNLSKMDGREYACILVLIV